MLQHAASSVGRTQRDTQVAPERMVGLHPHAHLFAQQSAVDVEDSIRRQQAQARQCRVIGLKLGFQTFTRGVSNKDGGNGRISRSRHEADVKAATVGGVIDNGKRRARFRRIGNFGFECGRVAKDQRGLVSEVLRRNIGRYANVH